MYRLFEYFVNLINDSSMNRGDIGAGGIVLATVVLKALPTISVALSIVWVSLRIYVLIRDEILKKKDK